MFLIKILKKKKKAKELTKKKKKKKKSKNYAFSRTKASASFRLISLQNWLNIIIYTYIYDFIFTRIRLIFFMIY